MQCNQSIALARSAGPAEHIDEIEQKYNFFYISL